MLAAVALALLQQPTPCDRLTALQLPDARITMAESVHAGGLRIPGHDGVGDGLGALCRVALTARPTADSNIGIEIWMPADDWNGRLLGVGGGGYAGAIGYQSLASGARSRFAVATTDMGTSPASGDTGAPHLIGRPERWSDFGWRSTHLMTVFAKRVVSAFYGRAPHHSYFSGCSTGGMQGLREAQQFPDDYDGILAGSPGSNRARIHVAILSNYAAAQRHPDGALSARQLEAVHRSVLESCGAPGDAYLLDPPSCSWSPASLGCSDSAGANCLNEHQIETVEALYDGPRNPRTGESIFPGLARGSELGWDAYMPPRVSPGHMPWRGVFEWVFGEDWDWQSFDYDQDMTTFETVLGPFFVATSPDLSRFRALGGKLLLYNGWADWLSATQDTIDYYQSIVADVRERERTDEASALRSTQDFARLFLLPGMSHCSGGSGPDRFDGLGALIEWVEQDRAPERLTATKIERGVETERSAICAFPAIPQRTGSGDARCAPPK